MKKVMYFTLIISAFLFIGGFLQTAAFHGMGSPNFGQYTVFTWIIQITYILILFSGGYLTADATRE